MTIIVCLGATPETWWQAKNMTGELVLERAESLDTVLKEGVWRAVEEGARAVVAEARVDAEEAPPEWIAHVDDLARELKARRLDPDRPGAR